MSLQPHFKKIQPGKTHVSKNRCFWSFWSDSSISGDVIWPKLLKRHIYTPKSFISAYFQVTTTIRYRDAAWKRTGDGQTDGRTPWIYRPQPLGLGPKYQYNWPFCENHRKLIYSVVSYIYMSITFNILYKYLLNSVQNF